MVHHNNLKLLVTYSGLQVYNVTVKVVFIITSFHYNIVRYDLCNKFLKVVVYSGEQQGHG